VSPASDEELVLLLRHGRPAPAGGPDPPLGAAGAAALRSETWPRLGRFPRPTLLATSPLRRARDTARCLAEMFEPPVPLETWPELGPESDPSALVHRLAPGPARRGPWLLVSHAPALQAFWSEATGGGRFSAPWEYGELRVLRFSGSPKLGDGTPVPGP